MGIDAAATAWLLASTAMVVFMTLGLGFFYGGLVRRKNVVATIALCFLSLAIVSIQWIIIGYTLSFAPNTLGGFVGDLRYALLNNVDGSPAPGTGIPHILYAAFQMAFAGITLAILTSAFAERVSLGGFMLLAVLWTTLVYDPVAHWVWGGGWLGSFVKTVTGATPVDFAGGTVVHIASGFSALALALVVGKRLGFGEHEFPPHNIPLTLIGAAILWFGWFGFNAGSALAANANAANALMVTHIAACAGALSWGLLSWAKTGRMGSLGIASGAVAGLVAITPAAGYVGPLAAIIIGAAAGAACYAALSYRLRVGLDESLDAWAVHGVGGLLGAILTGVFAEKAIGGVAGLIEGNPAQLAAQVLGALIVMAYAFTVTYLLGLLVDKTVGLRVTETEEYLGLDIVQHGEEAYSFGE
ncbi:MAG: ammonium transporter [Crenarchaeota archaeon]|nr:ammonium transporter [Thermoproteota archaeon]